RGMGRVHGEAGRRRVEREGFGVEAMVEGYRALYEEMAKKYSRSNPMMDPKAWSP
ncbi:MAG: hypothetical protein HQL51_10735, partial [Magnetococcales bacterium]|nr:hypothetical protein [Magnetococcales bacterium]